MTRQGDQYRAIQPIRRKQVLLAKQTIYNRDLSVFGFELLFRSPTKLNAIQVGEDAATSEVLVNYTTSITQEIDRSHKPIFVNVSESFILSEAFLPIANKFVVIELLERITVSPTFVSAVKAWHAKGYRFALDDYDFDPRWDPLLPYVDFIKVDILAEDLDALPNKLKGHSSRKNVQWLAECIEDQETLERCKEAGFDLFQGYFLARPREMQGSTIRPSTAATMRIISRTGDPDSSVDEIAELVGQDPKLSMQLLKLINSAMFTLPREIQDLREAITFLGIDMLRQWAIMIAIVSGSRAPIQASCIILARAKSCELYFNEIKKESDLGRSAFLAALISGTDVLLHLPPKLFIQDMQFSTNIQDAILSHKGVLGKTLKEIRNLEFDLSQNRTHLQEIDPDLLSVYSQAQHWAEDVIGTVLNADTKSA